MWFLARSSRVTGPKMRVPIGSFWLFTSTAALLSKRIRLPSGRRTPWAVRTIDGLQHFALLHASARNGFLDAHDDGVADTRISAARAAQHLDAHHAPGAGIVGDIELGCHLNHNLNSRRETAPLFLACEPDDFPRLQLGNRPALADANDIADLELRVFDMGMIFLRTANGLPITGCVKRRSTFTTTVLAFLSLTTTPCSTRFGMYSVPYPSAGLAALFGQDGLDARDFLADDAHAARVLELPVRTLEAQIELLLLQLRELVAQLVRGLAAIVVCVLFSSLP